MRDSPEPTSHFHADRPITTRTQDLLNRRGFAEALAQAILGWKGHDSLVIGLSGSWGSGKSSIKNMALDALTKDWAHTGIHVIEFNPWQFANRDQLAEAFFREVGKKLGSSAFPSDADRKRTLTRWERYGSYLKVGVALVEPLSRARVIGTLLALPLVSTVVTTVSSTFGYILGSLGMAVAVLVNAAPKVLDSVLEALKWHHSESRPLTELKAELREDLRRLAAPLVVVIDDVDRLTPDKILVLIQLVKANADFPNVVYLLIHDRDVVRRALGRLIPVSGDSFLEKVVQVDFAVPNVNQTDLDHILSEKLEEVLTLSEAERELNVMRWRDIYLHSLRGYFGSLRNVYRFVSSLAFHVSLFRGPRGSLDVNVVDLIALEALCVFEPGVYRLLPTYKALLTGQEWRDLTQDREQDTLAQLLTSAHESRRESVRVLLETLFPFARSGSHSSERVEREWRRDRRVCSSAYF